MGWIKRHSIIKSWLLGSLILFVAGWLFGFLLNSVGLAYLFGELIGLWTIICVVRGIVGKLLRHKSEAN